VQPVTIAVVVPGGKVLSVPVPEGDLQFHWPVSIPAGTDALFMMSDARGGLGGVSDIKKVGASDERSCLNEDALSSTYIPSSTTSSQTSPSTGTPKDSQTDASSSSSESKVPATGIPISAIASTVIGSLLFLAVIVTLGLFFLKNMKKKQDKAKEAKNADPFNYGPGPYGARGGSLGPSSARLQDPFSDSSPNVLAMGPYPSSDDPFQSRPYYPPSPHTPSSRAADPFNPSGPPVLPPLDEPSSRTDESSTFMSTTSRQQKAAMAGESSYKPTRFIVHDDAEDAIPPNADGVVELPPMYTERRAPTNFVLHNPDQAGQIPNTQQDPHSFPPRP
jgi:hypothetical protein